MDSRIRPMVWCHQATSHYLSQCWPRSMLPYGVTKPQWVKASQHIRVKVRSHCVRVRISFSIRFSFRVRRTVYTESEFLSVFDLISCPQLPRQTSKCDFVSGLARFGWKRTSVSVFHGRGTDRNGTDANLMALNRRLIRKLMQSKHCF